jgi:crossover junction endodeoxyribonuclease RusA
MMRLVLPYPISANRYWASRVVRLKKTGKWASMTYVTPEAQAYKEEVAKIAIAAGVRPLTGRVEFGLQLYPLRPQDWQKRAQRNPDTWDDDVRCIDTLNADKVLCDALNGVAWFDDKQIRRATQERCEPDAHGARVVVTIEPIVVVSRVPGLFPTETERKTA